MMSRKPVFGGRNVFFSEDSDLNFGRKVFDYGFDLRPNILDVGSEMIFGKFSVPSKNPNS